VNVGSSSADQTFTLTNSGTATATGCSAPTIDDTTNFTIATDNCGTNTLASGSATCTVLIHANPTTTGAKSTTLSRTCTFGGVASTTANQIVTTGVAPSLAWSPLSYDFGNVEYDYGKPGSISFTFTNSGTAGATGCSAPVLTGTNSTQFEISIDNCGTNNLAVGASCTVNVRPNLTGTGFNTATLSRTCTFGGATTTTADQITATGIAASPNLVARTVNDADSYGFREVATNHFSSTLDVIIGNTGTATASGCGAPTLADTTNFSLVSYDCGATIASGAHCTAKVRGRPLTNGTKATTLSMTCTGTSAIFNLQLDSPSSALPTQIAFGDPATALMTDGTVRALGYGTNYVQNWDGATDAIQIAGGFHTTCTLRSNGTIQCLGDNTYGQLGIGTNTSNYDGPGAAVNVSGISTAIAVAGSLDGYHTCAILADHTVWCWGKNDHGQLGNNSTADSTVPVQVSGISTAIAVALGENFSCAVLSGGTVQCWGINSWGNLGDGTTTERHAPVTVETSAGTNLTGATSIAANPYFLACATKSDGTAYCWGNGGYGGLGNGSAATSAYATQVSGITTASSIAISYLSTCALLTDGTAKCWGENGRGQLGDGTTTRSLVPVTVAGLTNAMSISATNGGALCAVLSDHSVQCWGANESKTANGNTTSASPIAFQIPGLTGVTQVASGDETSCALISDGTVKCWGGWASNGQAGSGFASNVNVTTPTALPDISGASQVAATTQSHCALIGSPGSVKCWGYGGDGRNGDGTTNTDNVAVDVSGISTATQIAGGGAFVCALLADTTVECWGVNAHGQLGDGTTTQRNTPVVVAGLTGVTAIYAGGKNTYSTEGHACAILGDATVKCWGSNSKGQLGDGTTTDSSSPVTVAGLSNVTSLALGDSHTCATLSDGTARCWGNNSNGQLGDGTTTERHSPTNVLWYSNVASMTAGNAHTCAILTDGKVRCWGSDGYGQLGTGNLADFHSPISSAAFSVTGVTQMASGLQFNCTVITGGTVKCWGSGSTGKVDTSLHAMSGFIPPPKHVVQTSTYLAGGSGATISPAFSFAPKVGNTILVGVWTWAGNTTTVTDSAGNTYALMVAKDDGIGHGLSIYAASNIASPGGPLTLSVTTSGYPQAVAIETEGLDSTSPLDQFSCGYSATNGTSFPTGSTATTSAADEILFSVVVGAGNPTVTWGYDSGNWSLAGTEVNNSSHEAGQTIYREVNSTGSYSHTWTASPAGAYSACIATFQ
jgi:alpha-tubulin suppressor-like RCC1 family protein